jgi:hypothetical protein
MIAFETLLLGIITGLVQVRVLAASPVAAVELRLDAVPVGVVHGPPWAIACDLGSDPMPHELTAIGRDGAGREVARATQWVNIGRERVKLSAILERSSAGREPDAVLLAWETAELGQAPTVIATLDGAPLAVADPHRIALPNVGLAQPHLVSVEAAFSPELRDRADLAFGGDVLDRAESELTAVAVALPADQRSLELHDVTGLFSAGGRPLTPVGVDAGPAEVALVVDRSAKAVLADHPRDWESRSGREWGNAPESLPRTLPPVDAATDRFYTVDTIPSPALDAGRMRDYFEVSAPMKLAWLARFSMSTWLPVTFTSTRRAQAISDAVAVAGSDIAASNHRRAVVLVLAEPPPRSGPGATEADASTYGVPAVKTYLATLGVPLVVWSLTGSHTGPLTAAWGPAIAVRDRWEMQVQAKQLQKALASQRIVWFAGRHLPQRITLDTTKTALRLAQ